MADGFSMGSSNFLKSKSNEAMNGGAVLLSAPAGSVSVEAWHAAIGTFIAFIAVGMLPLLPFAISVMWGGEGYGNMEALHTLSLISAAITFACFVGTGAPAYLFGHAHSALVQ